ncbi:phospholipid phosphatase 3-like [Xiphophorus maculatus]|uniref:Phosphatidic acid phosphatase type 2D n=2 Tax=Xiphophorus TaxID=8082 RepID=A0A3B5RAC6_XIPMA|nr:phospholipid phosphatase 3-like [Xiphophorus maculatus]XP_027897303.1 phospholipid phosphatase 3-like [Xiphophorus couchianus]XP_032443126.1 phospholipid phosphatase 3-like [Xiphophorus hellerii]
MQKLNSSGTHCSTLPRDAELQLRLADSGGSGEGRENGAGIHFLTQPEDQGSFCTKRKMLVGLDVICLCVASIPFFACELKAVTPYERGFFCGDDSITYPYLEREAIPDTLLIAGGIAITGLTIALGECYRVRFRGVLSRAFVRNRYVSCLYKELGSFLFGCCVGQSLTNMAKLSVGRLRPYFLSVCNITYESINCTPGSYVNQVKCNPRDNKLVIEARKSFFSGHASFAMYTMLYLAFYLQARLSWRGARLLRPLVQFLLVMLAIYTGLSRISDYRHHPTDVLTGFIQGGLTAYWVAFHISSMFKPCTRSDMSPTSVCLESPLSSQQTVC